MLQILTVTHTRMQATHITPYVDSKANISNI